MGETFLNTSCEQCTERVFSSRLQREFPSQNCGYACTQKGRYREMAVN